MRIIHIVTGMTLALFGCSSPAHKRAAYIREHNCKIVKAYPKTTVLSMYGNLVNIKASRLYDCPELGTWVTIYDDEEQP